MPFIPHPDFDFVRGDIRDEDIVLRALEGVESVVSLAAIVGDPACKQEPEEAQAINYSGTCQLARISKQKGVRRFLFASTCSNYGLSDTSSLATEDSPLNPLSHYAQTKVEVEKAILGLATSSFQPVILRFATAFGCSPRMRFDLLINEFAMEAFLNRKLIVFGEQFWRPYIHIHDISRAICQCIDASKDDLGGEIFNVGGDDLNFTKREIVDFILHEIPGTSIGKVEQAEDPRSYRVSFSKIKSALGFEPEWTVISGIREILTILSKGIINDPFDPIYRNSR